MQFLRLWEKDNNSYFNEEAAEELIEKAKQPSFTITAKLWIKNTRAIGSRSKQGHGGSPCPTGDSNRLYNMDISGKEI